MSAPPRRRWPLVLGAIAAVLVLLAGAGVLLVDRLLLSTARDQAAALSARTGRAFTVDGVATKLWGGLGVRVTGVGIGPAQGEDRPLLGLRRAEVELDLVRALTTRGRELVIRRAELEGLRLDVLRLADGTTNLAHLSRRLDETAGPAAPAPAPAPADGTPLDVSGLRVDRAAVENARIAFLDRTVPGAAELFVDDLDVEVQDLAMGKPLEVRLAAAVLATKQNLALTLRAAPLPATLVPTFTGASLRVEPIDLAPLLAFLPASVGLRTGRLQADLEAVLGAAAAGGTGPTSLKGSLAATGLSFAALEQGRPFDVTLDLDVDGDAAAGDLRLGRLALAAGPASVTGRGRVTGLRGDAPRVEGLELVTHGLDLEVLAGLAPPLRRALGEVVVAGPIGLSLHGGGSAEAQRLTLAVDLTPVRLAVPGELTKAAGAAAWLTARLDATGGGRLRFDASLDLAGVDLRPGGTLAKGPGDALAATARGQVRSVGGTTEATLEELSVTLLGDRLTGKATATSTAAKAGAAGQAGSLRFDAEARGARLDLDRLLLPTPEGAPAKPATVYRAETFAGLGGTATLRLGAMRAEGVEVKDVVLKVTVAEDLVTLTEARLVAFGGTVKADGTQVGLARAGQPVTLKLDLAGVAGKELMGVFSKLDVLDGRLDARMELTGKGLAAKPLLASLNGSLGGLLAGGVLRGADLVAGVTGPLAQKLPFAAKAVGGDPATGAKPGTPLGKELPFDLAVADGKARLVKPITLDTGRGPIVLEGTIGLDGTLDLPATLSLSPEAVSALTLGKVKVSAPLPIGFKVAGPAWKPRVEGLALDGAVRTLAGAAAGAALGKVGVDVGGLQEQAAGAKADAGKAAAEAKAKAEAEAKQAAADAKRRLEEEARKKLQGLFGK